MNNFASIEDFAAWCETHWPVEPEGPFAINNDEGVPVIYESVDAVINFYLKGD